MFNFAHQRIVGSGIRSVLGPLGPELLFRVRWIVVSVWYVSTALPQNLTPGVCDFDSTAHPEILVHRFLAIRDKAEGNYTSALRRLRDYRTECPDDLWGLKTMGQILFSTGDYKGAVQNLEQVVQICPRDTQAHYVLMLSYRRLGQLDKADYEARVFKELIAGGLSDKKPVALRHASVR